MKYSKIGLVLMSLAVVSLKVFAGEIVGTPMFHLDCNNLRDSGSLYHAVILTGSFEVNGKEEWDLGADVYSVDPVTHKGTLLVSVPIASDRGYSHESGMGFSLDQNGPGEMTPPSVPSTFPATMTFLNASGDAVVVPDLQCETNPQLD